MSYYIKMSNGFRVANGEHLDIRDTLPLGNYIVKKDSYGELYLETIDGFEVSGKIYGQTVKQSQRIFDTFMSRTNSTGVLLVGEKGSGKTLLAKYLSAVCCANEQIPTITINNAWTCDSFKQLIQNINQPCMILFDEFEKVYNREQQESILTLLDGVFSSKKLFVLTCNDTFRVDHHLKNRPGRIFYMLEFKGLDEGFIREYCTDRLDDQSQVEAVVRISKIFTEMNFDMLKALIEEMNRYHETPQQALSMLNAKPEYDNSSKYKVSITLNGRSLLNNEKVWTGNPLSPKYLDFYVRMPNDKLSPGVVGNGATVSKDEYEPTCDPDESTELTFDLSHLKSFDASSSRFIFVNEQGIELTLTKVNSVINFHPLAF